MLFPAFTCPLSSHTAHSCDSVFFASLPSLLLAVFLILASACAQAGHLWRVPHLGGYGDVRARTLHCAAVYSMAASRFARVLEALRALPEWSDTQTGPR